MRKLRTFKLAIFRADADVIVSSSQGDQRQGKDAEKRR
jgi:hypothetical protein